MKYYHAAPKETMIKIYREGVIKKSWDGMVYLCKEAVDACKFLAVRGMKEIFFKCKAYIHNGDIKLTGNEDIWDYSFNL